MGDAEKVGDGQNINKDKRIIQSGNIHPSEILDRVADLLDSNIERFTSCRIDIVQAEDGGQADTTLNTDVSSPANDVILEEGDSSGNVISNTAKASGKQGKNEDLRSARKAKTEYYILKKKILAAKSDEMELQNKKLKLEIEALKQKNLILKKIKPIKLLKTLYS